MAVLFNIIFFGLAGLIGLWAVACLISGLLKKGPIGLFRSYISALTWADSKEDKESNKDK